VQILELRWRRLQRKERFMVTEVETLKEKFENEGGWKKECYTREERI